MNRKITIKSITFVAFFAILLAYGCNESYYADGGVLDDNVGVLDVSTMEYLKSQSEFDTLTTLIEMCGLEDEVNADGNTFLAARDYSIHNYFELRFSELTEWPALSDFTDEYISEITEILGNYIIPNDEIIRDDLTTTYSYTTTYGGKTARFNLTQEDYLENVDKGAEYIVYSLDVSSNDEAKYQSVNVVTSDLQSTNGIIHILDSDSHIFGFN